jgi:hypothetical protein
MVEPANIQAKLGNDMCRAHGWKDDKKKEIPEPTRGSWGVKKTQLIHIAIHWLPPAQPDPLPANVYLPSPFRPAMLCPDWLSQPKASQAS